MHGNVAGLAAWQNIECFGPNPEHTGSLVGNIAFKHYTESPEGYVAKMVDITSNKTLAVQYKSISTKPLIQKELRA